MSHDGKRVISFDVGIKNLAYCAAMVNADHAWDIVQWGIIDLTGYSPPKCSECERKATFHLNDTPLCGRHGKKGGGAKLPQGCANNLIRIKLKRLREIATELGLNDALLEHKGKQAICDLLEQRINETCLVPVRPPKAAQMDMIDIGRQMATQLDTLLMGGAIDVVLVENQIGTIATRMRTIQGMIYQYFILRHPAAAILTISSSNKLKVSVPEQLSSQCQSFDTTTYSGRKKRGVAIVRSWLALRGDTVMLAVFESSRKKDDLADSLLQLVWYAQS